MTATFYESFRSTEFMPEFTPNSFDGHVVLQYLVVGSVYLSARLMSFLDTSSHFICIYFKMKMMPLIWTHEYHNNITEYKYR